jgi:hypothetical protein
MWRVSENDKCVTFWLVDLQERDLLEDLQVIGKNNIKIHP